MKRTNVSAVKKMHDNRSATGSGRKLMLHRETLRRLMKDELRLAAGGIAEQPESFIRVCVPDI